MAACSQGKKGSDKFKKQKKNTQANNGATSGGGRDT
jgi:hypothetical protein